MNDPNASQYNSSTNSSDNFVTHNPNPVLSINSYGKILFANPAAKLILEDAHEHDEITICNYIDSAKNLDFQKIIINDEKVIVDSHFGVKYFEFIFIGFSDSGTIHIYGSDITDRINSENSLIKWASFVENNPAPVFRFDLSGKIVLANLAAENIIGQGKLLGAYITDIFPDFNLGSFVSQIYNNSSSSFEHMIDNRYYNFMIKGVAEHSIGHIYGSDITQSKIAEIKIRENEARFRKLFEKSPNALWEEDFSELESYFEIQRSNGIQDFSKFFKENPEEVVNALSFVKVLNVNKATLDLYKAKSSEDLVGNLSVTFTASTLEVFKEELIAIAEGKDTFQSEAETMDLAGNPVHIFLRLHIMPKQGKKSIALLSMMDITQNKQLELKLRQSEQKFRGISSSAQDAIIMTDEASNISFWNEAATRIFGYTNKEVMGKNIYNIIIPEDFRSEQTAYFTNLKSKIHTEKGKTVEIVGKRKDNTTFPIELSLSTIRINGEWNTIGIHRDVSKRKESERELNKLTSAIVHNPASIVITDKNGIIEYVNPKFSDLTGYTFEEALGKTPRIVKSGIQEWPFYKELWDTITSGDTWKGELQNQAKDGSLYWESVSISPIFGNNGEITNFVAVKENITERKDAEVEIKNLIEDIQIEKDTVEEHAHTLQILNSELFESEQKLKEINSSKDKFFSIIAHDLRGPFSGFLSLSDLIAKEFKHLAPEDISNMAEAMNNSAKQLFNLLENLLEWARAHTGAMEFSPETIDVHEPTETVINLFRQPAKSKNIKLKSLVNIDSYVFADPKMLNTCLRNLVSNAIKFTSEGGRVLISTKIVEGNAMKLSVQDDGIGMAENEMSKIFKIESKHSTKGTANEKGTGLGLILCKELVERNGGIISVSSQINQGSIFSFTIPLTDRSSFND